MSGGNASYRIDIVPVRIDGMMSRLHTWRTRSHGPLPAPHFSDDDIVSLGGSHVDPAGHAVQARVLVV